MTLLHVLGGASLLILVAVSTVVRAGLGVGHAYDVAVPDAAERRAEAGAVAVEELLGMAVPAQSGPLRDRLRP